MSLEDKEKWDAKYAAGAFASRTYPSVYLQEQLDGIKRNLESAGISSPWRALDIACGAGRNTHYLAHNGFNVDAIDISAVGLERAAATTPTNTLPINWRQYDLDKNLPAELTNYHLIVMMRYVNLPLLETLEAKLVANGFLLCETHMRSEQRVSGPQNQNFRVAPGDLEQHAGTLTIEHVSEGLITDPDAQAACVARILARKTQAKPL